VKLFAGRGEKNFLAPPLFFPRPYPSVFAKPARLMIKGAVEMNNLLIQPVALGLLRRLCLPFFALVLLVVSVTVIRAQGAIEYTGTGGKHTIEGRIYFPSGRQADGPGIKISLETSSAGTLTVYSDSTGTFAFRNLTGGTYTVVIPGTAEYDQVREAVYIDDPGSSSMRTSTVSVSAPARTLIVPIYLLPKRTRAATKTSVLDATLVGVPKAAVDNYQKALESIRLNDHKKAIAELEAAVIAYPQFTRALNELGVQYLSVGQVNKAVQTLQSAVRYAPDDFIPRLNYGIALLQKKDFRGAEEQLRLALLKNDAAATAHMYLGITLLNQQNAGGNSSQLRYDEAEKELQRALTLGGDSVASAHYYLAGIYWRNGQHRRAAEALETYLKLTPNAPNAERTKATIKDLRSRGD
jgi:tetratricopeptide (TPR) repeat protein